MTDTPLAPLLTLAPGRAHEFCGPARRVLALWALAVAADTGPVIWLRMRWNRDRFCPQGLLPWIDPARLIIAQCPREADLLACTEEALRAGACAGVVADLPAPPALVPLRRLHLAASEGLERRQTRSPSARLLALVLTPGMGGTAGVETRWHLAPRAPAHTPRTDPVQQGWTLSRLRARMAPPAEWGVEGDRINALRVVVRERVCG